MNLCIFTGRLTASPELTATPNGKNVCNFTLAVERRFKGTDGKPIVDYIEFVAWEHNATFICKWFDKGVKIAVTSACQPRPYTDKEGNKRKVTEFLVNTVEFADGTGANFIDEVSNYDRIRNMSVDEMAETICKSKNCEKFCAFTEDGKCNATGTDPFVCVKGCKQWLLQTVED